MKPRKPEILHCGPNDSFFKIIDSHWGNVGPSYTLHRVCTLMRKMGAQTIVKETLGPHAPEWQRLSIELNAIRTRAKRRIPAEILKFTFVNSPIQNVKEVVSLVDDEFLGYAIIVTLELTHDRAFSYIFESVVREPGIRTHLENGDFAWQQLLNNYLHVKKTFEPTVSGNKAYKLTGTFFCQQNTITSVCAHACATMVLNNCPEISEVVSCEHINEILGIDHKKRKLKFSLVGDDSCSTHEGLSIMELEAAFQSYGFATFTHDFRGENRKLYRDFLYGFVESGYPAVLAFSTTDQQNKIAGHVVPVFGHTLNSDSWFPTAFVDYARQEGMDVGYLSTLDWVPDFVVHDDNYGMYFCLPAHSFRPESHPDPGVRFTPRDGIGIYPIDSRVRMLGYRAEGLGFLRLVQVLHEAREGKLELPPYTYYLQHLLRHVGRRTAVVRATLITSQRYVEHLGRADNRGRILSAQEKELIEKSLGAKRSIWLVEVSEPDLYVGNKSKVVDILLDPSFDPPPAEIQEPVNGGVILMRFPGFLLTPHNRSYGDPTNLTVNGHMPLFLLDATRSPNSVW